MKLADKIGQFFLMGFRGGNVSKGSKIEREISKNGIGGIILFDKDMVYHRPVNNIESPPQVKELVRQLQSYSKTPLLVSIDQEGGLVNRLKPEYGFPATRSHLELGNTDRTNHTLQEARLIAGTLRDLGINLNLAPVVDVASDLESSIIGKRERSFGTNPKKVTEHAQAYIQGHQEIGILSCCKHFPGLGSATGDTHYGFVDATDSWEESELDPYKALLKSGQCSMIMTTHVFNGQFDKQYPATLSKATIQSFLRDQLGYDGVVISDDMQMQSISDHYSLKESLELGILAGVDMFCYGNNLLEEEIDAQSCIDVVLELVADGRITETRIQQSYDRIMKLKEQLI